MCNRCDNVPANPDSPFSPFVTGEIGKLENLKRLDSVERNILSLIVFRAIQFGYAVSVFDGEEFALKRSKNVKAILEACAATEMDSLHFYNSHGERIGHVLLIYGNGRDLISDCSCGNQVETILDSAMQYANNPVHA
jgi:hypothetical protein